MGATQFGIDERVTSLEEQIQNLEKRMNTLEQLIHERVLGKDVWKITLWKTVVDQHVEDPDGTPDLRVRVLLNAESIFDTAQSEYYLWYNLAGNNVYDVDWGYDLPLIDPYGTAPTKDQMLELKRKARAALTVKFSFGLGDRVVVEILDRDTVKFTKKDRRIARWNVGDPSKLEYLISDGTYVNFKVQGPAEWEQSLFS